MLICHCTFVDGRVYPDPNHPCPNGHTRSQISITFTDVSLEFFALLSGQPLTTVTATPQNRDAWRRATLTKGTP